MGEESEKKSGKKQPVEIRGGRLRSGDPIEQAADESDGLEAGTHPLVEKTAFPQVNRNTPHVENQYSPYRPEEQEIGLELTSPRWSGKTAGQGQYSPCLAKYSP